jgi:hypothetical protein
MKPEDKLEKPSEKYFYFVDGQKFESDKEFTAGAIIKSRLPEAKRGYALYLEGHGNDADQLINDDTSIPLEKEKGPKLVLSRKCMEFRSPISGVFAGALLALLRMAVFIDGGFAHELQSQNCGTTQALSPVAMIPKISAIGTLTKRTKAEILRSFSVSSSDRKRQGMPKTRSSASRWVICQEQAKTAPKTTSGPTITKTKSSSFGIIRR